MRKTKDAVVKMTDRLNPEAFLAAKDAAQEAFQANKDWHDITTAMLSAYDKSITAYLAALPEPDSTLITDELTRVAEALHGYDCPDDPDPGEACTCDGDTYYRMAAVAIEAAALPTPRTITTVEQFINQRPGYITALQNTRGTDDQADYHRWQGGAEARRQLAQALGWTVPRNPGETTQPTEGGGDAT